MEALMKRTVLKHKSVLKKKPLKRQGKRAKSWRKKLLDEFKPLIRARDGRCLNGGKVGGACSGVLQCSHIWPEGSYPSIAMHPKNAKTLCKRHHLYWWHRNPIEARDWLFDTIDEDWGAELHWLKLNSGTFKVYRESDWRQLWVEHGLCS